MARKPSPLLVAVLLALAPLAQAANVDETITQRVSQRLQQDPELASQVRASAQDGIVKLEGRVATMENARRAVELARSAEGVRSVWVDFQD